MKVYFVFFLLLLFLGIAYSYNKVQTENNLTKRYQMKSVYQTGVEFCEYIAYYFSNNITTFCQETNYGQSLITVGMISYIIAWIFILLCSFLLFYNINNF